jgi:hypothetical protein
MKNHIFQFDSEASAIADSIVGAYRRPGVEGAPDFWDQSYTIPNEAVYISGALQSGFWMEIGSGNNDASLSAHPNCRLAWDPDNAVILGGTWTGNDMAQVYVSPVPAGSYNPWNGAAPQ